MKDTMRNSKIILSCLGLSALACGQTQSETESNSTGLHHQSSASFDLTYDTHEAYLTESTQGFGCAVEIPNVIEQVNDVQAFRVQTQQTSNGQRSTLVSVQDLGCEIQLSSTAEGTTGVLVWCPRNRLPANAGIWDNDQIALRVFNEAGKSQAIYQPSVRSTLRYRSWGLRADLQIPTPVDQVASFRVFKASYANSGTEIVSREELSGAICQTSLTANAGYPTSQVLVRCSNAGQTLQAGERIEIEYQTRTHYQPSSLIKSRTQFSANSNGVEAKLTTSVKLSEIKNVRAYRKIQVRNSDQTTGVYLENFDSADCTLSAQALDANQSSISLECNSNNATPINTTDEVVFVFVKQQAPEAETLPPSAHQVGRLEVSDAPHSQTFGNL